MRALVQRVSQANVTVEGDCVAQIGSGLLIFVGVTHNDDAQTATALAGKVARLRIFADGSGRNNDALVDGDSPHALVVSQFTLYGDTRKGTRPNWMAAAPADIAAPLVQSFATALAACGVGVQQGIFGANMQISLVNDGPVTFMLEV